jgi:ABC-type glycerol-3-phosphate transport system substrate-binding protein
LFLSTASSTAQEAAAWAFVRWFEDPAQQATEFFPTRRSATPADPDQQQAWQLVTHTPETASVPIGGIYNPMIPVLGRVFQDAGSPRATLAQALHEAQIQADQLVADYDADPIGFTLLHPGGG